MFYTLGSVGKVRILTPKLTVRVFLKNKLNKLNGNPIIISVKGMWESKIPYLT